MNGYIIGTIKFGGNYIVNLQEHYPHSACVYWRIKHLEFQAMRANCMLSAKTSLFFIKLENIPFYVAEIEAHSLGNFSIRLVIFVSDLQNALS